MHKVHFSMEAGARRHVPKPDGGEGDPGEVDRGYDVPALPLAENGRSSKDVQTHEEDGDRDRNGNVISWHIVLGSHQVILDLVRGTLDIDIIYNQTLHNSLQIPQAVLSTSS